MSHRIPYSFHYSFKYTLNILAIEIFLFYSRIEGAIVKSRHARKGDFPTKAGVKNASSRIGKYEQGRLIGEDRIGRVFGMVETREQRAN